MLPDVINLTVTQEDIGHAERASCYTCPVARAFQRTYSGYNPMINTFCVQVKDFDELVKSYDVDTPTCVAIREYDKGRPFPANHPVTLTRYYL